MLTLVAGIARMALAFRDVRSLSEARHLAATDDLTSLPNRRLFMRRVEEAITATELTGDDLAVLILDLDNFKQLNDTLGHHAGDALLRLIGPRLVGSLRESDIVARLGGDEFAVLVHPAPDEAGVTLVAEKIIAALAQPFEVEGLALRVTGSVGIASYPSDANDVAIVYALVQLADRLGMRVVAEGVENQETWDALNALDCELIQGYLLSRPLPAGELEQLLAAAPLARRAEPGSADAERTDVAESAEPALQPAPAGLDGVPVGARG